jgi:hypothetical protein
MNWLAITRGEVHETRRIIQNFIGCFVFYLKELGQLKGQEVQIILEDDNPIFRLNEVEKPWLNSNSRVVI